MTVVFRIGEDGNGTVYSGRSENEVKDLVRQYEKCGWKVTYVSTSANAGLIWYQID